MALVAVLACVALGGLVFAGVYLLAGDDGDEVDVLHEQPLAPLEEADSTLAPQKSEAPSPSDPLAETPPSPSEFEEARDTFRAHWEAIADGRYGEAYDWLHPGYEVKRSGWIATHETETTLVNMDGITVESGATEPYGDEYWLYVEVPVRDTGGPYAGDCRLFFGEVRMDRSGGSLLYRPGVSNGREGSFGRSELGGGIKDFPEESTRCP